MFTLTGKNAGGSASLIHGDLTVELAHYLRQATITRRRQFCRLNHLWCKIHPPSSVTNQWRH